jgi:hypothetical protein
VADHLDEVVACGWTAAAVAQVADHLDEVVACGWTAAAVAQVADHLDEVVACGWNGRGRGSYAPPRPRIVVVCRVSRLQNRKRRPPVRRIYNVDVGKRTSATRAAFCAGAPLGYFGFRPAALIDLQSRKKRNSNGRTDNRFPAGMLRPCGRGRGRGH